MKHPVETWEWFGHAAHFICGQWCRFHMATRVGHYLVSTVGEYVHPSDSKASETTEGAWLLKNPRGRLLGGGEDSYYETFVFPLADPPARCDNPDCGCGIVRPSKHSELDGSTRWATAGEATKGHMDLCRRYADEAAMILEKEDKS